jgi:hypothetical protein
MESSVSVRDVLFKALDPMRGKGVDVDDARHWLERTEVLLEWISKHPKLVEINCEAAHLLSRYRGEAVSAIDVDYRGVGARSADE